MPHGDSVSRDLRNDGGCPKEIPYQETYGMTGDAPKEIPYQETYGMTGDAPWRFRIKRPTE